MTEQVNIPVVATAKGLDKILKDVEALRSSFEGLGLDANEFEKSLNGIETAVAKTSRALRDSATSTRETTRATRDEISGLKERLRTIKQSSNAEYELNRARKQRASSAAASEWDAEFAALTKLADAQAQVSNPSARYALYDVANAYKFMGTAMAGAAVYATVVAAQFEAAFTNVQRTGDFSNVEGGVEGVRSALVQLSGQIPLTFQELSGISTIGNQMGIAEENTIQFTSTVARFASVAGVSVEEVTKSFGGFMAQTGLSEKYLENFGSAMALVSINSNATEAQIMSLVREIAASASTAGFAADEIVGLAGSFASLQVAPERARGVLDTYFARLNSAVAEGGDKLQTFANITGLTSDALANMVKAGQGTEVFQAVLKGLAANSANAVELTQNLDALGLSGLRAGNTFTRLVSGMRSVDQSFADARTGFIEGAELNRQYAQTVDDLASQWTIFLNGLNGLIDAISGGAVPTLASLLTIINNVIFGLTEWLGNNKWAVWIGAFITGVIGIFGAMVLMRGMLLAGTAATYAMRHAVIQLGGTSVAAAGTMTGFARALFGVGAGATAGARGVTALRVAIRGLLAATGVGLLVTLLGSAADALLGSGNYAESAALSMSEYEEATKHAGLGSGEAAEGANNLGNSLGNAGKAAEAAAVKIRTLVDYVSDLNGVFKRSGDLRFGSGAAMDQITLKWIELNEQIAKYQQEARALAADKSLKEYWLGVAEAYDDQIRAAQLREEIAKIDDDLAKAQAGASTELQGNSKAAIENRKVFRDLLGSYEDYVSALASAGASQEQIQAVVSQLNSDFSAQAAALGYSGGEIQVYGARFQDLATIIARMPRDITIGFDPNPALQALNEFRAKAAETGRQAGADAGAGVGSGLSGGIGGLDYDGIFGKQMEEGTKRGLNWWDGFWAGDDWVHKPIEDFFLSIGEGVRTFFTETAPEWAKGAGTWVGQLIIGAWEGVTGFFAWLNEQFSVNIQAFNTTGRQSGDTFAKGIGEGTAATLNSSDPVGNWQRGINGNAWGNGSAVGTNMGNGILAGLKNSLNSNGTVNLLNNVQAPAGIRRSGFAGGGYTGAGHWLEPAGVVHRGEYVIPKRHVNQRTGLPDTSYVASLQRGKSAPKMGYASGGHVSGGMSGPMDLSASTLNYLANALSVNLNVGQTQLAKATSRGDSRLAFTGSN